MKGKALGLGLAMAGLMSAPVLAGYLVDNGSLPIGSGRTVSGPNIAGGWTVFQPFTVTEAAGWHVDTIGGDRPGEFLQPRQRLVPVPLVDQ